MRTSPSVGGISPNKMRSNVVLPNPLRPVTPMRVPPAKFRLRSEKRRRPPNCMPTPSISTTRLPSGGGGGMTNSISDSEGGGPALSAAENRSRRAWLLLVWALGRRRTHSISRRRNIWRLCSVTSSVASFSARWSKYSE